MARPFKNGLDYFSLDVDIANDDKIKLIKAKHGLASFAVVILLFTKIYKNGYFYKWGEDEEYLFADETGIDVVTLNKIVNDCINKGVFIQKIYEQYGILTSAGIQKRFLQACVRRKELYLFREYFVVDDYFETVKINKVTFTSINADYNLVNDRKNAIKKIERKNKLNNG